MKQHELRQPLIRSAVVLVVIFLLIAFVAGSDANGFVGGISSIFKGMFLSILFVFALVLAILFSIVCLCGIFFGAVALHSPDTSKEMFDKFKQSLASQKESWANCCSKDSTCSTPAIDQTDPPEQTALLGNFDDPIEEEDDAVALKETLSQEISIVGEEIQLLQDHNSELRESLEEFKEDIMKSQAEEATARNEQVEALKSQILKNTEADQNRLDQLVNSSTTQTQSTDTLTKRIDALQKQFETASQSLALLQESLKESAKDDDEGELDISHRIFNYLEDDKDKELFAGLIEEAIDQNLTYAEIDDLLSKSLTKDIFGVIKEHPSLSKQYIRDCKNSRQS